MSIKTFIWWALLWASLLTQTGCTEEKNKTPKIEVYEFSDDTQKAKQDTSMEAYYVIEK